MARWDRIAGWILVAVAVFGVWGALRLPIGRPGSPEPGFVPLVEAILLGLAGSALIAQAGRLPGEKTVRWPTAEARRMVLHLAVALTAYVLLLWILGFVPSTFLFVLVTVGAWRRYSWWVSAAYAAGVATLLQITFRVALGMPLPRGLLGFF